MGWQQVTVPIKQPTEIAGLKLTIKSVHAGRVYKDTCISDIQIIPDPAAPYDPKVQAHRHQQLVSWIAERQAEVSKHAERPLIFTSAIYKRQKITARSFDDAANGATFSPAGHHTAKVDAAISR